eukprot:gene6774-7484_t
MSKQSDDSAMFPTYEQLSQEILALSRKVQENEGRSRQIIVGLAGPPGAGKSTTAQRLHQLLPHSVVLPMDGYHYTKSQMQAFDDPVEAFRRRGAHWTFDGQAFLRDLKSLRKDGSGAFPSFDHAKGDPVEKDILIHSEDHKIVLVEGNYLLLEEGPWSEVKSCLDYCYFLHCPIEVIEERVRRRHVSVGSTIEEAAERVAYNDSPNARLILSSATRADRVVESL